MTFSQALRRLCSPRRACCFPACRVFRNFSAGFGVSPAAAGWYNGPRINPGKAPENGSEESEKAALSGNGGAERLPAPKRKGRLRRLRGAGRNGPDLRALRRRNGTGFSAGGRAGDRPDQPGFRLRGDLRQLCGGGRPDAGNEHHALSRSEGPGRVPAEMAGRQSAVPASESGHAEDLRHRAGVGKSPGGLADHRLSAWPAGPAAL